MSKLRTILAAMVLMTPFVLSPAVALAASCDQQAAAINNNGQALAIYKAADDAKYKQFHDHWASLNTYASQWVPNEASKAAASLASYDKLHAETDQTLDAEIASYVTYASQPLACSKARSLPGQPTRTLTSTQIKKFSSDKALIAQRKQKEANWLKKNLNKNNHIMIERLHGVKAKHPNPIHPKTVVK